MSGIPADDAPLSPDERVLPRDRPLPRRGPDKSTLLLGALFTVLLLAVSFNVYLTLTRTSAACDFYHDLAGVPVANVAGTNKPSELGVTIVAHSRQAFRGSGCNGPLPPPDPSFVKWAPYYHVSAR